MAVRDHTLDKKIEQAAFTEFLENGFQNTTMRKIADRAGLTTGALYVRFENKDKLFCSLLTDVCLAVQHEFDVLRSMYYNAGSGRFSDFQQAMKTESEMILRLIFDNYDAFTLLLCRSDGSSLENFFDTVVKEKTEETLIFLKKYEADILNPIAVQLIISSQFALYRQIIRNGYSKQKAKDCMSIVMDYCAGGWERILNRTSQFEPEGENRK